MGYNFTVFVFVVGSATLQVNGEDIQYEDLNELQLGNAFDDLLETLRKAVADAATGANATIEAGKYELTETAYVEETNATLQIIYDSGVFLMKVYQMKELAKNHSKNIDDCLEEKEYKLRILPYPYIIEHMDQCISDQVDDNISSAQDAYDQIYKVALEIDILRTEFEKCGTGPRSVSCKANTLSKVQQGFMTLPAKIEHTTTERVHHVLELFDRVMKCSSENIINHQQYGNMISNDIEDCAYRIIFYD